MLKNIVFLISAMTPLGFYFIKFHGELSKDPEQWAYFGSYIAGIYGALAFLILAANARSSSKQSKKQEEDNIFFRLFDSLQNKISGHTTTYSKKQYKGQACFSIIIEKVNFDLRRECRWLGKRYLIHEYEKTTYSYEHQLRQACPAFDRTKYLKIMDTSDLNERYERFKSTLLNTVGSNPALTDAFENIGQYYFFKTEENIRSEMIRSVLSEINKKEQGFIIHYYNSLSFLLEYSNNKTNREIYENYLNNSLSSEELSLIYYMLMSYDKDIHKQKIMLPSKIKDNFYTSEVRFLIFDAPSEKETLEDIDSKLKI